MFKFKNVRVQEVKTLIIIFCLLISLIVPILSNSVIKHQALMNNYQKEKLFNIKTTASWTNTSLTIDNQALTNSSHYGNWNWAVKQPWCSGLGTFQNPYIIENLTLSIGSAEYGLSIQNSRKMYFELINVEAHGAIDENEKGLYITNSTNGKIKDCNFTSNYFGIYMYDNCDNFTLIDNDVSRCTSSSASPIYTPRGIFLQDDCDFNIIVNNTANQLGSRMDDGIYLLNFCDNNTITNNDLIDVDIASVYLRNNCHNNTIYDNNVTGSLYGVDVYDFCSNNLIHDNFGQFNSYGIRIRSDCTKNQIINNKFIHGSNRGISLDDSMNNSIIDNELIDNGYYGIDISYYSNNNKIINNTILDVSHGGIILTGSSENNVSNNKMFGCGIYVSGSTVQRVSNLISTNNRANGKPIYYYLNQDGLNAANFVNAGQIILVNCTNCDIISFTFYNVTVGISLLFTSYSNIVLNTITECTNGYFQDGGQENQIVFNTFSQNIAGIDLENTDFNNVSHNTANSNGNYGIWIGSYSENNTIHDNVGFSNGLGGLHIRMSDNNTCTNNRFSGTSRGIELLSDADQNYILNNEIWSVQFGILLQMGCDYNVFKGNNITSAFGSGIQLASSSSFNQFTNNIIKSCSGNGVYITQSTALNNTFSLNAFIQNSVQGQDSGTDTHWTKNDLGNYWDDYMGNDTNNDKIGDTPYFIPPNGIDDRPLMEYPFTGNPPLLAELFLFDYVITNSSLTITIKNSGDNNATEVKLLVEIESIPVILYNNSLTPFDLQTNETEVIVIDLIPFQENFTWGEIYNVTVNIDPQNQIVEQNELNNQFDLEFHYRPYLFLPDLVVDNYILTSGELWINITNKGNDNASAVELVVEIEMLSLTLFNNTLSPVDINVSYIFGIYVNLSDYAYLLTVGETYNITIRIDPRNTIVELNENNNLLILQYYYLPSGLFPDLLIESYSLVNDILSITILNNGTDSADNITLIVWIDSLSLILYNETVTPSTLDVNQTTVIVLDLEDFFPWFIDGTDYIISALVDPLDIIIELHENNNQVDIIYSYEAEVVLQPSIPWQMEFVLISTSISLVLLIIRIKKKEILRIC